MTITDAAASASVEAVDVEMGRGQTQVEVEAPQRREREGLRAPAARRVEDALAAVRAAARAPAFRRRACRRWPGARPLSLIASAPSSVCPALVSVASPSVNESGRALDLRGDRNVVGGKNGRRLSVEERAPGRRSTGRTRSNRHRRWAVSPSASAPPNASLANGESSANTIGLGAPLAAVSGSLSAPAIAKGVFRHTADRLKRS